MSFLHCFCLLMLFSMGSVGAVRLPAFSIGVEQLGLELLPRSPGEVERWSGRLCACFTSAKPPKMLPVTRHRLSG